MIWHLLIPKGAYAIAGGVGIASSPLIATVHITITTALVAIAVTVVIGIPAFRNNFHTFYRNQLNERNDEIKELKRQAFEKEREMADFAEAQRDLRHDLKTELAATNKQLDIAKQKTELPAVLDTIREGFAGIAANLIGSDGLRALVETQREITSQLAEQTGLIAELVRRLEPKE